MFIDAGQVDLQHPDGQEQEHEAQHDREGPILHLLVAQTFVEAHLKLI